MTRAAKQKLAHVQAFLPVPGIERETLDERVGGDEWSTDKEFFFEVDAVYGFVRDLAAAPWSAKCASYFSKKDSAFNHPWNDVEGWQWLNMPYSEVDRWVERAIEQACLGARIGMLPPARTDRPWYRKFFEAWPEGGYLRDTRVIDRPWGFGVENRFERLVVQVHFVARRLSHRHENGTRIQSPMPTLFVTLQPGVR